MSFMSVVIALCLYKQIFPSAVLILYWVFMWIERGLGPVVSLFSFYSDILLLLIHIRVPQPLEPVVSCGILTKVGAGLQNGCSKSQSQPQNGFCSGRGANHTEDAGLR